MINTTNVNVLHPFLDVLHGFSHTIFPFSQMIPLFSQMIPKISKLAGGRLQCPIWLKIGRYTTENLFNDIQSNLKHLEKLFEKIFFGPLEGSFWYVFGHICEFLLQYPKPRP